MNSNITENQSENLSILVWKLALGSAVSWEISKYLGSNHPYLAPLSVILTIQSSFDQTISISVKRVIGTLIGISVTVLIAKFFKVEGWSLGLLILIGCFTAKYFNFSKKVIHQVALTILFVFVFEHQTGHYAFDRLRDTIIGVLVAGVIQMVWFHLFTKRKELHF
ncbi:Aromatic acid exporter family member 1 [Fictibacillus solisalsi]|uniref:Aromatic acid exporter family member 1 n=1 Tax=Fictibacillus solisalsi TaxID=459525 RepID=A0A1G9VR77_9BACL|nr:FUSC family protein [Fictibacillus solisalsi]SDM74617.1 Aromatic acid exporter family member 1 [Fictibacillus solisalsi]